MLLIIVKFCNKRPQVSALCYNVVIQFRANSMKPIVELTGPNGQTFLKSQMNVGAKLADVFTIPNSEAYLYCITSMAAAIDKPGLSAFQWLNSKTAKALFGEDLSVSNRTIINAPHGGVYSLVSEKVAMAYWQYHANKGHKPALDLLAVLAGGTPSPDNGKVKQDKPEQKVQLRLQRKLGGAIEVVTPAGKIDLLTSTEIIEIKKVCNWKAAIGQVMVYSLYYPSHQRRIHLFGQYHQSYQLMVEKDCEKLGIIVTWENESDGLNTKSC